MRTAMILASGRGERLKPVTDKIPKSLCIVKGRPLIEHHVINLARAGFERLVINHAYLGGQIRQYLGDGSDWGVEICYSPEVPGGLETAGGIVKALPLLGSKPFLTVNADIYTDYNFTSFDYETTEYIHVVLTRKNPSLAHHGDFGLINNELLSNENREYIFSGIAYYHPQVFTNCKQGRYSVTPMIRELVDQKKATGTLYHGIWFDIGTIDRLLAANK